ncbi:uncharacterized protein OGAPODRAFT_76936 [Ogataea polymorpha]|uniref:uncharacterized protein n=1 Tax=Ogataea polymorpha TaxID=460523 RepID=UPI0007F4D8EB|nr:uncharacterized protein OGAPODRAFT_76936 [Ogataea polymorpha]KAG7930114.1 hypothetical protein KL934_005226 [Ogataea polymorpha]OBA16110.1 hypothetical protein OGAPODRAFT_76936 [Ogataea polymorpha]
MAETRKYRSRKSRPCDFCRRRRMACLKKEKADKCEGCGLRNQSCTYTTGPIKKKRPDSWKVETANPCIFRLERRPDVAPAENNALELHNGKTSLFVGFSGDRDPWLLRRIGEAAGADSGTTYLLKNTSAQTPIVFAMHPTEYLEPRPGCYEVDAVREAAKPVEDSLLETYFSVVNSSYPIMNQSVFYEELRNGTISATLLASMYVVAYPFFPDKSVVEKKAADWFKLSDFTARALPLEQGASTMQTVQATLLKLHERPMIIRDANFPRHWVQTASLVASAQELGLHIDPVGWDIPWREKAMRRRLWWLIYVHDKWESLGLSRPSHIHSDDFSVGEISESDYEDTVPGVRMFLVMVRLTKVLSELLTRFYTVKALQRPAEESMAIGVELLNRIDAIDTMYFPVASPAGPMASLVLAKTTLALSCCRSILYTDTDACYASLTSRALNYCSEFNVFLTGLQFDGFWWCYSQMNFSIVGTCMLAFYVIAQSKVDGEAWKSQVECYRNNLSALAEQTHVTQLALMRFDALYERIGKRTGGDVPKRVVATDEDLFGEWLANNGF